MGEQDRSFENLEGHRYARLSTYRKCGEPVPTPVWFALDRDRAYVFTDVESGKVKRIRDVPRVTLAASSLRGRPRGKEVRAEAHVLDPAEHDVADRALRDKYGWRYRLAQAVTSLLGLSERWAFLELRLVEGREIEPASAQPLRYSGITVHDRSLIKSYLQRRRLRDALSVLDDLGEDFAGRFLDFGGGSGELSRILAGQFPHAKVLCYEPSPDLLEEARQNLSSCKNVVFFPSLRRLKGRKFRYVFCLEVFEHLPRRETVRAIREIDRLLGREGILVVGVPNELFIPALIKGFFRMTRRYGSFDAKPKNVLRAVLGRPPKRRPVREIAPGLPYHFHHTGFDHRKLRIKLSETFEIVRQFASPVGGGLIGTEIYFILKKRDRRARHPERGSTSSR